MIGMRRTGDVRYAIGCGHFDHGQGCIYVLRAIVEAKKKMVMNIDHDKRLMKAFLLLL
jgi:hypothetical protein